jgi:hypothetical protein
MGLSKQWLSVLFFFSNRSFTSFSKLRLFFLIFFIFIFFFFFLMLGLLTK